LANSMFLYIYAARLIYDYAVNSQTAAQCNGLFVKAVQEMEDVISYYYQGGSTFDSDFWRAAVERAKTRLAHRKEFSDYLEGIRELRRRGIMHRGMPYAFSPHTWPGGDAALGYGTFDVGAASP